VQDDFYVVSNLEIVDEEEREQGQVVQCLSFMLDIALCRGWELE